MTQNRLSTRKATTAGWLLLLIPAAVYLAHAWVFRGWLVDDAAITFAYARNLAHGYGLVAQPGAAPVEAYSNFLWLLLYVPFFWLRGFDPVVAPKIISAAIVLATYALVYQTFAPFTPQGRLVIPVALTLTSLSTPFVVWTTSGLENPLYALLVCLLVYGAVRSLAAGRVTGRWALALGVLAACAGMTRPDGVLYVIAFPALLIAKQLDRRTRALRAAPSTGSELALNAVKGQALHGLVLYGLGFLVLYGGFYLFRWVYFGDLLPNTYYAKGGPSLYDLVSLITLQPPIVARILDLVAAVTGRGLAGPVLLAALVATVYLASTRGLGRQHLILGVFLLAAAAVYLLLPNDGMAEYRFATAFVILFYLFVAMLTDRVLGRLFASNAERDASALPPFGTADEKQPTGLEAIAGLSVGDRNRLKPLIQNRGDIFRTAVTALLIVVVLAGAAFHFARRSAKFAEYLPVPFAIVRDNNAYRYDDYAAELGISQSSVLLPDLGATLYYSQVKVYDLGALADKTIARTLWRDRPALRDYIFETARPTFIHIHDVWTYLARLDEDPRFQRDYAPIYEYPDAWVMQRHGLTLSSGDYVRRDALNAGNQAAFKRIAGAWRTHIALNQALFTLASGDAAGARRQYDGILAAGATAADVRDALNDVHFFLSSFPTHAEALATQARLREMESLMQ
ncbi:MAG: hypothetical protein NT169_17510 [Chloroflexi bacterium]|nr:hypothetical protein [Chloroflexota bacterium]